MTETTETFALPRLNEAAPQFSANSTHGQIKLSDFKGKSVVIYFYPKDMTPGCTREACDFQSDLTRFKKKSVVILGVSKDSPDRHRKFKEKYKLAFSLLSDEDGKMCEAFGVWQEKSLYGRKFMGIVRTTFIIGPDGKIRKVFSKVKVKDHVAEVLEELK